MHIPGKLLVIERDTVHAQLTKQLCSKVSFGSQLLETVKKFSHENDVIYVNYIPSPALRTLFNSHLEKYGIDNIVF